MLSVGGRAKEARRWCYLIGLNGFKIASNFIIYAATHDDIQIQSDLASDPTAR